MKSICTKDSLALRQLIEKRSDIKWASGIKPTENSEFCELIFINHESNLLTQANRRRDYEPYITSEEFITECARRFPKERKAMKDIYTENSLALRQMIEERSDVKWNHGEKPTEYKSTGRYLFLCVSNKGLTDADRHENEEHVTPEEFASVCALRFPKTPARPSAVIIGEIEKLFEELKEVTK